MGPKLYSIYVEIISALLIILFIYTGLNKLLDHNKFQFQLGQSPFIEPMAGFISIALPAGELVIAALLIFKRTRLPGLYASIFLMALFTAYVYIMLRFSYDLPCSCGGVLEALSWESHLIFNSVYTVLALTGAFLYEMVIGKQVTDRKMNYANV
jgi:uncharacterized membrane protein YphA (DoxX/SURF4 family)